MPTDDASAALAAEVEVPGPRSRGSSDTVSPTVITLPSSAWRSVADEIDWVARLEPLSVTDRAPYTVTGATSTAVSSRRPALDSVTSSSSAVPVGVPGRRDADDRGGGARARQRHRIPLPDAQRGNDFGVQPDHAAAGVQRRGVQPRGQREVCARTVARTADVESGHVSRRRPAQSESRHRPAVRLGAGGSPAAPRAAAVGLSSHTSGCAASQRLAADGERDVDDVGRR